ncbi:MAG TPA: serine/threonine-protein kinase [Gemmataceae bacterium]|jgi:hypothetical protein
MSLADNDGLAEELIDRMALYDAALADSADPTFLDGVPLAPSLQPRWGCLKNCLRQLRDVYPSPPPAAFYLGEPSGTFGRFRIRREIGRGGFGIVLLADDPHLERPVALKVPRPEALVNADLRQRFLREARAAAALDHPNLVPVYESGEAGGVCYIASAYCPGVNLAQWLQERSEPVSPPMAASLIACLAEAVHHAHGRGILHRDLKPSNVLLVPRTAGAEAADDSGASPSELGFVVKLTDFGLAKLLEAEADQTSSGGILGTPVYMAPEQAEGWSREVGAATDVYALGVILYELLTRRLPFQGASLLLTLEQTRSEEPMSPRRLATDLPRDLETICLKCLRKDPRQRYPGADALAGDLRRFLRRESIQARPACLGTRLANWCRRPQRIRDAAFVALVGAVWVGTTCTVGLILLLCGVIPNERPLAAIAFFLVNIVVAALLAWTARNTSPRNVFALWAGFFLPFSLPVYSAGAFFHWIDAGRILDTQDRSLVMAQMTTVFFLSVILWISYSAALIAYYANRRRPGFAASRERPTKHKLDNRDGKRNASRSRIMSS